MMSRCPECRLSTDDDAISGESDLRCEACCEAASGGTRVHHTPLERGDLELTLAWRSHPDVYHHFRRQEGPLDWENHVAWFESRSSGRYDFMIHYAGRRVGVVSLNVDDQISIYIGDHSAREHGVATKSLQWLCRRFRDREPLIAEVHENNYSSRQLFERCNFERTERDGEWLIYAYKS